uniref:NADH-ubiquinone oxidoreductase chain 1 n=1 Tax=Sycobia sp. 2 JXW-2020 TaxID=2781669 RepID=A0A8A6UQP4_9HYME|nr:NADH dehydrogenase subunit 1 [Sycobia sp. 2 JXW-2020]
MFFLLLTENLIMILISIAFLTLLERKILGYIQIRKGPNKVSMFGLIQPFSDAIKLFIKENFIMLKSNYLYYIISPMFSMFLMLMLWSNMMYLPNLMVSNLMLLMIFCLLSLGVYSIMVAGWSSNSIYSLLGGLRGVAQTISYEVSMMFLMISMILLIESFNMYYFMSFQNYMWFVFFNFFIMFMMLISFTAEVNRTPFDLAEGESELVSGFNTEYMSGSFALIFIAEYGMIMFMMFLFSVFFLGANINSALFYYLYMTMLFMIIWFRGAYPRYRYDNLMNLIWKSFLPSSLNFFILNFSLLMMLNY